MKEKILKKKCPECGCGMEEYDKYYECPECGHVDLKSEDKPLGVEIPK